MTIHRVFIKNSGGGMVMGMRHRLEGVMDVSVFTISLIEETCRHVLKHKLKCQEQ